MKTTETHIFQINKEETKNDNQFFAFVDNYDFLDKENNPRSNNEFDDKTLAKIITRENGSLKYMIKVDHLYKPFNPVSIYGNKNVYRGMDQTRPSTKFIGVNVRAFNAYINFLKTKNISWLHNTEREMQ
jgi:hypothetical protein